MLNLSQLKSKMQGLGKPLVIVIIALVIIGIAMAVIFELRQPPSEPPLAEVEIIEELENDLTNTAINQGEVTVSNMLTEIENYQEEADILTYTPRSIDDELITTAEKSLGVTEESSDEYEGIGEIIRSREGSKRLTTYKGSGDFLYTNRLNPDPNTDYTFSNDINEQEYRSSAEEFVRSMGVNINKYELTETNYLTYPNPEPQRLTNVSAAGLIEFVYTAEAEDSPLKVIDSEGSLRPDQVTIWIDKSFTVRRALISVVGNPGNATARVETKTIGELRTSVQNGEAKLLDSSFPTGTTILYTLVEDAELMYYASGDRLIPVYVLNATLISEDGEEGTGRLVLTAF